MGCHTGIEHREIIAIDTRARSFDGDGVFALENSYLARNDQAFGLDEWKAMVEALERAGAVIVEAPIPSLASTHPVYGRLLTAAMADDDALRYARTIIESGRDAGDPSLRYANDVAMTHLEWRTIDEERHRIRALWAEHVFTVVDAVLAPVAPTPAFPHILGGHWSERRLNHHTEASAMLYAARECARLIVEEGLEARIARHRLAGEAMAAGLVAMGLTLYGDQRHKMFNVVGVEIPDGVHGERARAEMLDEFGIEIGTSFGPLAGRIWRIGTMGYNARRDAVLTTLAALEAVLRGQGVAVPSGAAVDAARAHYAAAERQTTGGQAPGGTTIAA